MSPKTQEALAEIKRLVAVGYTSIVPYTFSACYGRAATSAAFRIAKKEGIIEVAYVSMVGTPVYRPKGYTAMMENAIREAATAAKH